MVILSHAASPATRRIRSEDDFLQCIDRHFPRQHGHVVLGRGDDCAILSVREPGELCLSTDLFLEDVHFRQRYCAPGDIGHKALAVNISDIAAMGGQPLGFSLGLMAPPNLPAAFWDECFAGMAALAARHDVALTGGDLSGAPSLGFSVSIWGEPAPGRPMLRRGPVLPGDVLLVLGEPLEAGQPLPLGLARQGLRLLEAHGREAVGPWPACCTAHLRPAPQVAAGLALAGCDGVHGCMDISDGLARDLPRLLAFGQPKGGPLGAALALEAAQLHPELVAACAEAGADPVAEAMAGGEDYLLLAAVTPEAVPAVTQAVPSLLRIGTVTEVPGLTCNGTPLAKRGFDHFSE